jgi:lipopolysaccharide export LptBFGC system permease protein LptF
MPKFKFLNNTSIMKKIFLIIAFISAMFSSAVFAQNNENAEAMLNRLKERVKPQLVEKAKITEAQADRVIEINFALQRQRRQVRMDQALSDEEKAKRTLDIDIARDKEFLSLPLTSDQIKAVNAFFDEDAKQQRQGRRNN